MKSFGLGSDSANQNDGGGRGTLGAAIEGSDSHPDVNGICLTPSVKLLDRLPFAAALAGMFCAFGLTALATPGDLDTTFAGTGIVRVGFGLGDDRANGAALQSDGKIVVVGSDNFSVARYNADGSLDTSFDGDGKVVTPIGTDNSVATAVKIQGDGRIVVAGYTESTLNSFAVVRYNTDGSLDSSFGSGGKVVTTPEMTGLSVVTGNALAIQADGKIVVAGSGENAGKTNFAVLRFNSDGSLDTSFDADGIVTTAIGSGDDVGNAVTILADKIIVAGSSFNGLRTIFALVRYNSNGSLDTSFDLDGIVTTEVQFSNGDEAARAVTIQIGNLTTLPDKIVVAGSSSGITKLDFAVVRYNLDGSLDTSFDADGKVTTPIGAEDDVGQALTVQGTGNAPRKITVAGSSDNGAKTDFAVVRYNADGSLDTSFDLDGIVTTSVDTNDDAGAALVIQTDGKVVVAGSSTNDSNHLLDDFALVRYNSDGSLDSSFGGNGKRIDNIGDMGGDAKSLAIQTDGKIVVAGSSFLDFALFRSNSDGSADTSFNGDGRVTTDIGTVDEGLAVALQADNKIVVAGSSITAFVQSFAIARYNPNGSLDPTFNGDGVATTLIDEASAGTAVAVQADGKIVVAGLSLKGSSSSIAVVRYNANGSPDTSFDGDGVVVTSIGNDAVANAVAIQTDGRIVVAGSAGGLFAVVRYDTSGSLDTSFDGDGIATTAIDTGLDGGNAVAIQTDGRIVVSGFASGVGAVARYNSNGTTDLTFNGSGKLIDPDAAPGTGVAIQTDGKILVVGTSRNSSNFSDDFAVVRYNSDGRRDSSYGNDGGVAVDVSLGGSDVASAITLDLTGRAVVAGTSAGSFGVIRLLGGPPTTFANISTRLRVETGDNVLIGGFIITGSQAKKVMVRAIGPSLPLADVLANPVLELHDGAGTLIASNDNWMDALNKQEIIDSALAPSNDFESAILTTLDPGLYTAIVRGVNDTTGIALVEAYDLDLGADSILANISTRGLVQTDDNVLIGGIIILGTDAQEVLLRAIGPSLPLTGALADPTLELHDKNGVIIASNDNWRSDQEADIIATAIAPTNDAESAILATLTPDAYTAIVRGKDNTTGVALVEAYQLDN
jgi:uncharacterized delta-60 repeat protein